jgi:NAD(P)H-dependent FMN reductase
MCLTTTTGKPNGTPRERSERKRLEAKPLFIPILLGTVRQDRVSERVAKLINRSISERHLQIETEIFDVRSMDLPSDDEGPDLAARNPKWRDAMIRADGLIIVTPEYNHAFPGSLKRALDVLLKEYIHKAVGLCGVSSTWAGGVRAIEALVPVVRELGLAVTFTDLYFPHASKNVTLEGVPSDPTVQDRVDLFLEELTWMCTVLRWGRQNLKSRYH